ncbi:polysaccharide lyase [uncultured Pontibacter sp.]|uniref:polysaccharide lyase n=1 Tax=uncultured Pontibacter sp. TaxID=453356 RepID=UPI0026297B5D|nr:polysaccharide lyase [uncultured Pontibacter sp.]
MPLKVLLCALLSCDSGATNVLSNFGSATTAPGANKVRKNLLFESTFEEASSLDKWYGQDKASTRSIMRTDSAARDGKYAARFEINKTDVMVAGGKRAELTLEHEKKLNIRRWYGMSIYLPASYSVSPEPEIVAQWHVKPDDKLGEDWRSPPIALLTKNGRWWLAINWAKAPVNSNETIDGWKNIDLGPYNRGAWSDWVFEINFSWKKDGLINVWQNDTLLYSYTGPNAYNDKTGPFLKVGLYKWEWQSEKLKRYLYYDEVRVGDDAATYYDVRPGNSSKL